MSCHAARSHAESRLGVLIQEIEELSPHLSQAALQAAASRIISVRDRISDTINKRKRLEEPAIVVSEAAGTKLHLSDRSLTGYAGVSDERAKGLKKPHHAIAGKLHGKAVNLGYFSTPVEAAIAIARYRLEHPELQWQKLSSGDRERIDDIQAAPVTYDSIPPPPSDWAISRDEALLVDVEDVGWVDACVTDVCDGGWFAARITPPGDMWHDWFNWQEEGSDWKRVPSVPREETDETDQCEAVTVTAVASTTPNQEHPSPRSKWPSHTTAECSRQAGAFSGGRMVSVVSEAAGTKLHLSDRSLTGYAGVSDERAKGLKKPHHAIAGKLHGKAVNLGYFSTPVEAAIAIARYRLEHPELRWRNQSFGDRERIADVQVTQVDSDDDDSEAIVLTAVTVG